MEKVLSKFQYWFREGYSIQQGPLLILEKWVKVDDKGAFGASFRIPKKSSFSIYYPQSRYAYGELLQIFSLKKTEDNELEWETLKGGLSGQMTWQFLNALELFSS